MRRTITTVTAVAALVAPAAAHGHVTLQPKEAPPGGFARLDVRVPNERGDAATTKIQVKFPPGFPSASIEPVAGWTAKVARRSLETPLELHGEEVTEEVDTVTWTGKGREGAIGPGEFRDFGLSVAVPDKPGAALTFKALQTYEDGEVVRWIGPPDGDEPAPQVELAAAADAADDGAEAKSEPVAAVASGDDGDDAPTWLAVVALAVGLVGLLAAIGALSAARRRTA